MSASDSVSVGSNGNLKRQIPSFVAVGVFGYIVDASVTFFLARVFKVDPFLARVPAFSIATVCNFALNRALTFSHSRMPIMVAFVRYVMVCAAGLVVNFMTYATGIEIVTWLGVTVTPPMLPIFVAAGSGVAMFVTFFGFRFFAFRR